MIVKEKTAEVSVLLVEDNPGDQLLIKEHLDDVDSTTYRLTTCCNLAEALSTLKKEEFDIIILDPGLPDSSGLDCLKNIRITNSHIPIILLTVNDSDEMGLKAIQNGAQDFLNKNELTLQNLNKSIMYAINRKSLEQNLTRSLRMYESAFEQAVAGFAHLSLSASFLRVNRKFCDIVGYSRDDLLGKSINEVTHPDDLEIDLKEFEKLISGKIKYYTLEKRFLRRDGTVVWAIVTRTAILNSAKEIDYFFTTVEDINERKSLLTELQKQKGLLENILNILPVGICIFDGEGSLISSNKKFDDIWMGSEYRRLSDHKKYRGWKVDTGREIKEEEWASYKALKYSESTMGEILKIECFDGSTKVIINSAIPLVIEGKVTAAVAVIEDITRLAETEDKLKKLLAEKDIVIKESNHRIKNNLQLMSSLLNLQAANTGDLYVREVLNDSISRIASVSFLHDFLYRSASLNTVNIPTYIEKVTDHIRQIFLTKSGKVKIIMDIDEFEVSSGLAVAIGLVLTELVTNAVKYAFPGRKDGIINIELKKQDGNIHLRIGDNGIGINGNVNLEEVHSLGLQIVYSMITQYHGTIEFKTDAGTEFIIDLPLK